MDLGLDSLTLPVLINELDKRFGVLLELADFFSYPTMDALSSYVHSLLIDDRSTDEGMAQDEISSRQGVGQTIAIIGMSCRLPGGVEGPIEFWDVVAKGLFDHSVFPVGLNSTTTVVDMFLPNAR